MGVALAIKIPTASFLMFLAIQRKFGSIGQVAKTPPFHGGNEGSNPACVVLKTCGGEQLAARWTHSPEVVGSNPTRRNLMAYSPTVERLPVKQDVAGSNPAMPV